MSRLRVAVPMEPLAALCRRWRVSVLAVFGSALRDDFQSGSDIDLLVTFAPTARWGVRDLFRLQDELEALLGRKVDLGRRTGCDASAFSKTRSQAMSSDEILLLDMLLACEKIERFVRGIDGTAFLSDELRQEAILRQLTILGEAAEGVSATFRGQHPGIPWQDIGRFRDLDTWPRCTQSRRARS